MTFIEDALFYLGLGKEITPYSHRVTLYGKSGCLIEGVKKILFFSENRIEFSLKNCALTVVGENLKIKKYGDGEVAIVGVITGANFK
ncbi:MAG: YabP/YqfC family sporulation protein [Clostridia bacterium]|nr:YabP/YqfC family sporulation protein [Clostridia bacterium]